MNSRSWRWLYWGTVVILMLAFALVQLWTRGSGQPAASAPPLAPAPVAVTDTAGPAASDIPLPPLDGELY